MTGHMPSKDRFDISLNGHFIQIDSGRESGSRFNVSKKQEWFRPPATNQIIQPFFCRIESKIDSKSKVPFRFRLGSLDYVNELEGKKN
jgi:hypothetical protein